MKKTKRRILALLLAALLVITSAPFSFAYENGEVVEDDGTEAVTSAPAEEQNRFPGAGTVVEEEPTGSLPGGGQETPAEGGDFQPTVPEVTETELATDGAVWQMEELALDQEAMSAISGTTVRKKSARSLPAKTQKVHYYRTVENFLAGANGKKFSITGEQVWDNTYIKVVVPLKADGSEDLANATAAYCLNAHLASPGESMSNVGLAGLSDRQSVIIGDILALGYKSASGHSIPRSDWYKWTITQIMIWAVRGGTLQYNTKTGVNELTGQNVSGIDDFKKQLYSLAEYVGGGQYDAWNSYADYLLYNVLNLRKLPRFAYKTEVEAKREENVIQLEPNADTGMYQMKDKAEGYFTDPSKDKVDKNGVTFYNYTAKKTHNPAAANIVAPELVSDFQYDQHGIDGLQIRWRVEADCYAGPVYGMEFTSDREHEDSTVSQKLTREIYGGKGAAIVYSDGSGGTTSQYIAAYTPVRESLSAYFAVRTGAGGPDEPISSGIHKESEDGVVAGIQFTLTGNGKTFTKTTNSNGDIDLSGLPLYKQKDVLGDDGNPTGETEDDLDNPITYTVRENVPVRYVTPSEQGYKITPAEGGGITFHNILKKWKVSFTKSDPQATSAQKNRHSGAEGDATLASAEYGLYCNGELIDTFYTDENGQFETWDYYPCGSADGSLHYTIREISPSTGYLLNSEEIALQTDPARYTQELNIAPAVSGTEQIIKGDVYLTKHTDKGETGIPRRRSEAGYRYERPHRRGGVSTLTWTAH